MDVKTYENEYLLLKWGTLKGWSVENPEMLELLDKYHEDGVNVCHDAEGHQSATRNTTSVN